MGKPIRVLQIMGIVGNGGVEAVIMNYYRHIDKTKVQFDFVVHKNPYAHFVDEAQSMGARIYEVTPYTKNIFAFTYDVYKIIKGGNYAIVHSNMNSMSGFPLFAAWFAGVKVRILHNHTTDSPQEGLRSVLKRLLRPFARLFANQYWACSNLAAEWMYGRKILSVGKVSIINNAIDTEKFAFNAEKREELRLKFGLVGNFVVGHVGRLSPQKNHIYLLEIFAEILKQNDNALLILIGDGYLKEKIIDRAQELGIENKMLLLGNREDVADLYNVMDVFLLPSLFEGLPVVGVEAQANGLPIIVSTEVTKDLKASQNIYWLSLKDKPVVWAQKALSVARAKPETSTSYLQDFRFDIGGEARKLVERYEEISAISDS